MPNTHAMIDNYYNHATQHFVRDCMNDMPSLDWNTAKRYARELGVMNVNSYRMEDGTIRPNPPGERYLEGNSDGTDVHDNWYLVQMHCAIRNTGSERPLYEDHERVELFIHLTTLAYAQGHEWLNTDEPGEWSSPWDCSCSNAEVYVQTVLAFDLENDEGRFYLESIQPIYVDGKIVGERKRADNTSEIKKSIIAYHQALAHHGLMHAVPARLEEYVALTENQEFIDWYNATFNANVAPYQEEDV